MLTFAMDLGPLVRDDALSMAAYAASLIDELKADVVKRIGT